MFDASPRTVYQRWYSPKYEISTETIGTLNVNKLLSETLSEAINDIREARCNARIKFPRMFSSNI